MMRIVIETADLISAQDESTLLKVLECDDEVALQQALAKITRAAISEYVEMLLGKSLPTRASEMQERRLYHLLKLYFDGRIPTEAEVSRLFQLTESGSRTLLKHVKTKFKFELEQELLATVRAALLTAEKFSHGYRVVIQSDAILQELRTVVTVEGPRLDQVSKVKNSAGLYDIPEDTFHLLLNHYGLTLANFEAAAGRGA